jgi:D-alanyl-D-alanine carboxypeptidase
LPGLQASIVFADGSSWTGAAGWADIVAHRPVTTATVFDIGSITKTFVAAEVMRLVEGGVLRLDEPLARWLPSYPNAARLTLRELLSHTSGLADYFWNANLMRKLDAAPRTPWNAPQLLPYIGKPLFKPGTEWRYSNTNYLLLGLVIEAATKRTLESELQTRFLGPLGLRHTLLQDDAPVMRASSAGPLALPYRRAGNGSRAFISRWDGSGYLPYTSLATALGPVGGIASRADEIARWGAALYGGRVVSAASLAAMEDVSISRPFRPSALYGLGTVQREQDGFQNYGHGGSVTGYRTALRYFPDFGATIAVLTNLDGGDPDAVVGVLLGVLSAASHWREGGPGRD